MQGLHKFIGGRMGIAAKHVDHIDGFGLNNTRPNLRGANDAQNQWNRGPGTRNTSGYKGVSFHKGTNKWSARIRDGERRLELGVFRTKEEAAQAYADAAQRLHGEFAWTT